jgi:chorismate mutase
MRTIRLETKRAPERPCEKSPFRLLLIFVVLSGLPHALASAQLDEAPAAAQAALTPAEAKQAGALLDAMCERLKIMHDVARWKWNADKAIEDSERERQLLQQLERRGREFNLSPAETRRIMQAQMEAGKRIQRADWNAWRREQRKPFDDVPDLKRELRPRIDRASEQLLSAFAALREPLADPARRRLVRDRAERALREAGLNEEVRAAALQGWLDETENRSGPDAER